MIFYGLGTGHEEDAITSLRERHPGGTYTLIRDDDAGVVGAENVWFAAPEGAPALPEAWEKGTAEAIYEACGGTVSYSRTVKI